MGSSRYPIREPFAGGLEALIHTLARELTRRGHAVTLFAAPGSDPALPVRVLPLAEFKPSAAAMADRHAPSATWMAEHHAYLDLMLTLLHHGARDFDIVHNNSLHHLPVAMASALPVPVLTTLHTPPLPWLESALVLSAASSTFTAVSSFTASSWSHVVASTVIRNGVDLAAWSPGPGCGPAVWTGRLVPEKAPHDAIDACQRAGLPLVLAGPLHDRTYFREVIVPRLGDGVRYAGHLCRTDLARLVGDAAVAVVTPAWDEPYGLVASEAMACGTPVAGYARGALPEVVSESAGLLVRPGDLSALAAAIRAAAVLDRQVVRQHAERACGLTRMVDEYELTYRTALGPKLAA
ncbi:glycosyltransferase [Nocardioides sp.]|uniref:glycosyltransferase n=1 Tax=Nocardioides sp. TaxID=35761 RepID=UPI0031FEE232